MITFSEAQLVAWISPVLWPFLRVLALFTAMPILSMRAVPMRARVALAFLIAVAAQPTLVGQPIIGINSPQALGAGRSTRGWGRPRSHGSGGAAGRARRG